MPSPETGASLQGEVSELRRELRDLQRAVVHQLQPVAPAATAEPRTASSTLAGHVEAQKAAAEERAARHKQNMETVLRSQAPDRGGRIEVERQLGELYKMPAFEGTHLESVDCVATLCRITSRHDSDEAMRAFVRTASSNPPFDNEVFYTYGEGNPPTTALYVARGRNRLPR
jgi:hypothetical protein